MSNTFFKFKQFTIDQKLAAMKVGTDGVLLGAWANVDGASSVLDIGTGTGVIALMIAQRCQNAVVHAVEIDQQSAKQSQLNFEKSAWADRLSIFNCSIQQFVQDKHSQNYDLIVSNPPYFVHSLKSPDDVRTLTRHADTLPFDDLLPAIKQLLNNDGKFCGIFPYTEGNIFIAKATNYGLYCSRKLNICSKPQHDVLRVMIQLEFTKKSVEEETLTIHTQNGEYTEPYKNLTKDFYLAF